jgi:hypothetical protein
VSRRRQLAALGVLACGLTGCGGGSGSTTVRHTSVAQPPEVLGVPAVGRFFGRCAPGARSWTLRFVAEPGSASDEVYELGPGQRQRRIQLDPGAGITWQLRPGAFSSREPADPQTHTPGATVRTTAPLHLVIEQGTEPHTFRVDVRLALAAALGDATACAPVSSQVQALTYFNGGP